MVRKYYHIFHVFFNFLCQRMSIYCAKNIKCCSVTTASSSSSSSLSWLMRSQKWSCHENIWNRKGQRSSLLPAHHQLQCEPNGLNAHGLHWAWRYLKVLVPSMIICTVITHPCELLLLHHLRLVLLTLVAILLVAHDLLLLNKGHCFTFSKLVGIKHLRLLSCFFFHSPLERRVATREICQLFCVCTKLYQCKRRESLDCGPPKSQYDCSFALVSHACRRVKVQMVRCFIQEQQITRNKQGMCQRQANSLATR